MPTPTWCCGAECGRSSSVGVGAHWFSFGANQSITATSPITGARSLRYNPSASSGSFQPNASVAGDVSRCVIRIDTLPNADTLIVWQGTTTGRAGAIFKQSDSKIYAGHEVAGVFLLGATGVSVTTATRYYIDVKVDQTGNTVDVQISGSACGQYANAAITGGAGSVTFFGGQSSITADIYYDDIVLSCTLADYPFGDGYVNHFVPTSDGTHNVAGAADFRTSAGVDILNADSGTTKASALVDDVPLEAVTGAPTDYINLLAPPNATDYVEMIFGPASGIGTPTAGPRAVEVIADVAQAGTGLGNMELRLNDNGTMGTIYTATGVAGIVNGKYVRAHFADPPSAATAWNANNDGSNGDFRDLRVRFGSPAAVDANPDQYLVSLMIEAEFAAVAATKAPPPNFQRLRPHYAYRRRISS